jgi:hypothetical protein
MKQTRSKATRIPSDSAVWDTAKRYPTRGGYVGLYVIDPVTNKRHDRMEHIVIYERAHHTTVPDTHCIHHLNCNPADNRVENLACIPKTVHMRMHRELRQLARDLAPLFYNVKSNAIVRGHIEAAQKNRERRARWGLS